MKCKFCGHEVTERDKFCGNCGRTIEPSVPTPSIQGRNKMAGKKGKKGKVIILGCVIAVLILGSIVMAGRIFAHQNQMEAQRQEQEERNKEIQEYYEKTSEEYKQAEAEFQERMQFPENQESVMVMKELQGTWHSVSTNDDQSLTFEETSTFSGYTEDRDYISGQYKIDTEANIIYLIFDSRSAASSYDNMEEYIDEATDQVYYGYTQEGELILEYNNRTFRNFVVG